jgi:hypothetical protein
MPRYFSFKPVTEQDFWNRVKKTDTCWLFIPREGNKPKPYGHQSIGFQKKKWDVHRLSWTLLVGPIPEGKLVLHKCDVGNCVNPSHLYIGTAKENTFDMHSRGRWCNRKGVKNPNAKLTEEDVRTIRNSNEATMVLADRYSVNQTTIRHIIRRVSYADVEG